MFHFLSVCMYCLPKCCFIELVEENTLCFYTVGDLMANDLRFYDDVRKYMAVQSPLTLTLLKAS